MPVWRPIDRSSFRHHDQSGCGASAKPADLKLYTVKRYVAELEALRAKLGFEKVALVGHSWGSCLTPAYAAAHPERVTALVLAGGAVRLSDYEKAATRWLAELGPAAMRTAHDGKPGEPAYDELTKRYYARHLRRLAPWPAFLVTAGEEAGNNRVYAYLNRPSEFQFSGALGNLDMTTWLAGIRVPTLITCGDYDEAPPWVGAKVKAVVRGSMLESFAGLSHMSHIEDPARVVGVTAKFLRMHA